MNVGLEEFFLLTLAAAVTRLSAASSLCDDSLAS